MKIHVLIPVRNGPALLRSCIESVLTQDDPDFEVVVCDDASSEPGMAEVLAWAQEEGCQVFRQHRRVGATQNIARSIRRLEAMVDFPQTDVVLLVDGDDRLAHDGAVSRIRGAFTDDVLIAWGNYRAEPPDSGCAPALPLPPDILRFGLIRAFTRDHCAYYNHPIAFRRALFDVLDDDDLLGPDGAWLRHGYDTALVVPMTEAAGERVAFIDEVLYVYRSDRPEAVYLVHQEETAAGNAWVLSRPRRYHPMPWPIPEPEPEGEPCG